MRFACSGRKVVQRLDDLLVAILRNEPPRRLHHAHKRKASKGHGQDESAASEVKVSPAHVIRSSAYHCVRRAAEVAHKGPRKETGDGVSDGPPDGHERDEPCVLSGEELEEVGGIEDVVASSTG